MFCQVVEVDEQLANLILRDAASKVLDPQLELDVAKVVVVSIVWNLCRLPQIFVDLGICWFLDLEHLQVDDDLAVLLAKLERVAQEVDDHLQEPVLVAIDVV